MFKSLCLAAVVSLSSFSANCLAAEKTVGVFVALADNEHQGIVPVPKALGIGDDPERNLYWGSADGLATVFNRSQQWKLTEHTDTANGASCAPALISIHKLIRCSMRVLITALRFNKL